MNTKPILGAGAILGAFAIAGVGLVVVTNYLTEERIAVNLREAMLDKFERHPADGTGNRGAPHGQ